MVVRRRAGISVAFAAYLVIGVLGASVKLADRLGWSLWGLFAAMHAAASVASVIEIGARTYHREAASGRAALGLRLLLGLVAGLVAVVAWGWQYEPTTPRESYFALYELDRRLNALAAWLCAVVLAFSARHWTLDPWHRDVLAGLLFYRLGFIVLSTLPVTPWWPTWLYAVTLVWWIRAAWRRDEPLDWPSDLVALVFPWRARR